MSAASQTWLPTHEFLALSGIPRSTFFLNKSKYSTRKEGKQLLVSAADLPEAARIKLTPPTPPIVLKKADVLAATASLFSGAETSGPETPARRVLLTKQQERQALADLKILQPLIDFCSSRETRARFASLRLKNGTAVTNSNHMAAYLAEIHTSVERKISATSLWRWKRHYEEEGLIGLARKPRADKGRSKWAEQHPAAAELVTATYCQPEASIQRCHDALVRDAARLGMDKVPSYASVCDFIATLPAPPVIMAREGQRAYKERVSPYLSRAYTDLQANEVWVADTCLHDVLVRDDCFAGDNAAIRPQLTALMDMRSRKLVGYCWVLNGSSQSITTALIRAVRAYGPCKTFYCDNGRDFQKVGRFATPANHNALVDQDVQQLQQSGALRQLGINVQFCTPYHPQAKNIERFFGTLHARLDKHFRHYTGGNAYDRPDATAEAAATHAKVLRMQVPEHTPQLSPLMAASDFIRMAEMWIEQEYNAAHPHSGKGMNGRTPDAVFDEGYPMAARRPFDPGVLDTLLWQREPRKVRECSVMVRKTRMVGVSAYDVEMLHRASEQQVTVCFDPNAPQTGIVCNAAGNKIADVRQEIFAPQSAAAGPMIAASMQQSRGLRNATARSIRSLQTKVVRGGHRTEIELLYERSLPASVADSIVLPVEAKATGTYGPSSKLYNSEDIGDDLAARLMGANHGS